MKKLTFLFLLVGKVAFAQFGVSAHHSSLPFVGFNYEIIERIRPEIRIGTDSFLDDVSIEIAGTYDILDKSEYEFYAGLGLRLFYYEGLVIPLGLNIFPFSDKKFGFHIEMAPILFGEDGDILRGSWGIRYRFLSDHSGS